MQRYIGTRDFYPEQMQFRNWMFYHLHQACRSFGYQEVAAPIVEYLDLYRNKTSEEIISEQIYTFEDRKQREIAIRPEMTPTLARMVIARQRELPRPIRWYSIANFMRYERPGHNRLREFYQLNVDIFIASGAWADLEVIRLAFSILTAYGARPDQYCLHYSHRALIPSILDLKDKGVQVMRLLDKKEKISQQHFDEQLQILLPELQKQKLLLDLLASDVPLDWLQSFRVKANPQTLTVIDEILNLAQCLEKIGCANQTRFSPSLSRGFDYYTGTIFEVFDNHHENRRSIFGGGRYDALLGKYMRHKQEMAAVGFGLGDVGLENFLTNHQLNPFALQENEYLALKPKQAIPMHRAVFMDQDFLDGSCVLLCSDEIQLISYYPLTEALRKEGWIVEENVHSKLAKQLKNSVAKKYRFALFPDATGKMIVKDLKTANQQCLETKKVLEYLNSIKNFL